jgi:polyprenyl P-hydroxybenzoate/phenylacrylic acid decarboxylase-like protein
MTQPKRLVIAITGATGAIYGIRALQLTQDLDIETHLIVSRWGKHTIQHETPYVLSEVQEMADQVHAVNDLGSILSSGSFLTDGMIIAPCSVRTLSAVATGLTGDLITRAADVTLKERRRLVLLVRETPLSNIHLTNMMAVTAAGGIVYPPMPAFYTGLPSVEQLADYTVMRVFDLFQIEVGHTAEVRWKGLR